ncbi:MAG TPA: GNAT family N-acetyltransferase [Candidatus Eisenbacteria bacterium]|nr:GNAT family N-acetyltransferase [Candidatus Eisenbacteria bacterium]
MTATRVMSVLELARIGEIDRSERITQQYRQRGQILELIEADIDAPRWGQPGEVTIEHRIEQWTRLVSAGGVPIGAFDGDNLIGFAVYVRATPETPAHLAVLHVTKPWRRHGIGRELTNEVVRLARTDGARRLYVSATPTRGTVDFYMSQGFKPLATPNERLFALEPDDIHLERVL